MVRLHTSISFILSGPRTIAPEEFCMIPMTAEDPAIKLIIADGMLLFWTADGSIPPTTLRN